MCLRVRGQVFVNLAARCSVGRAIVLLVETDGHPWSGWILKERDRLGDDVPPNRDGGHLYERGRVAEGHPPSKPRRLYLKRVVDRTCGRHVRAGRHRPRRK